jgi:RNA polymerase sigma factor (sigma-70 family)
MRRSDAEAIAASRADPEAFVEIFDRHFHAIHGYLRRRVGSALADDLAASTFTEAFSARRRYDRSRPDALPWLYGIASNLLRGYFRTEEQQLRAFARTGVDRAYASDAESDPRAAEVAAALAVLNADDRDTLLLFAWAELGYTEIATALGIPVGTVRSRLNRARRTVRDLLEKEAEVLDG